MLSCIKTLACCGALAAAIPAHAAVDLSMLPIAVTDVGGGQYSFTHGGWFSGGMVTGSFTGSDGDNNGQLDSSLYEITSFSMTFSGNGVTPAFSLVLADFYGLVYTLDGGLLGDAVTENPGLAAEGIWGFGTFGVYMAGPAVLSVCDGTVSCGIINATEGGFGPPFESTTPVPEPSSWSLLVAGFGLAGAAMRRRGRHRAA